MNKKGKALTYLVYAKVLEAFIPSGVRTLAQQVTALAWHVLFKGEQFFGHITVRLATFIPETSHGFMGNVAWCHVTYTVRGRCLLNCACEINELQVQYTFEKRCPTAVSVCLLVAIAQLIYIVWILNSENIEF